MPLTYYLSKAELLNHSQICDVEILANSKAVIDIIVELTSAGPAEEISLTVDEDKASWQRHYTPGSRFW